MLTPNAVFLEEHAKNLYPTIDEECPGRKAADADAGGGAVLKVQDEPTEVVIPEEEDDPLEVVIDNDEAVFKEEDTHQYIKGSRYLAFSKFSASELLNYFKLSA